MTKIILVFLLLIGFVFGSDYKKINYNLKDNLELVVFLVSSDLKLVNPKFINMDKKVGFTVIDNTTLVYKDVLVNLDKFKDLSKKNTYLFNIDTMIVSETDNIINTKNLSDKEFTFISSNFPDIIIRFNYSKLNFINKSEFIETVEKTKVYEDIINKKNEKSNHENTTFIDIIFQIGLFFILLYLGYYALRKMYINFKEYRVEQITALWNNMSDTVKSDKLTALMLDAYDLKSQNVSKILKKAIVDFEEHITELSIIIYKYRKSLIDINDEIESINYQIDSISNVLIDNKSASADRIDTLKKKLDIYNESLDELSIQRDSIKYKLENTLLVKVLELIVAFESIIADAKLSKLERELDKNVNDFNDKMSDISNSLETNSLMKDVDHTLSIERFKNELEEKLRKVIGD